MACKKTIHNLIIVINIGTAYSKGDQPDLQHFDKVKIIAKNLVENKIFSQTKDEVGLILMGSEVTNNARDINHVEVLPIATPSWEQVKIIENLHYTDRIADWVKVVELAIHHLSHDCPTGNTKTIAFLSSFKLHPDLIDQSATKTVVDLLSKNNIEFLCIGEESNNQSSTKSSLTDTNDIITICEKVNGQYIAVGEDKIDLSIFERQTSNVPGWKCIMDVFGLEIPIVAYPKIKQKFVLPTWKRSVQGEESVEIKRATQYIDKHRTEYNENDTITGYIYGEKPIPFTEEDRNMIYDSGPKSFAVYAFANKQDISMKNWSGDGVRIILPGDEYAAEMFYSLMQSVIETNVVPIVRKVWGKNYTPRMVALFPHTHLPGEPWCFVEIQLPYAEDRYSIEWIPLKSVLRELSEEQEETVEALLTSIHLSPTNSTVDGSIYLPGRAANPATQHIKDALASRALHPEEELPPIKDSLRELFERPPPLKKQSTDYLLQIRKIFEVNKTLPRT